MRDWRREGVSKDEQREKRHVKEVRSDKEKRGFFSALKGEKRKRKKSES